MTIKIIMIAKNIHDAVCRRYVSSGDRVRAGVVLEIKGVTDDLTDALGAVVLLMAARKDGFDPVYNDLVSAWLVKRGGIAAEKASMRKAIA
jgi:hypothetical protein